MLKNGRSDAYRGLRYFGCSHCNSKRARRAAKKRLRSREKRDWKSYVKREHTN